MSSVFTPTATKLVSVTLPGDTDPRNASSVNTPIEGLANGVAYATEGGADRLDPLLSLAALTAIAAPTNLLVRHVAGYGIYVFVAGAGYTVSSPSVLAADDATSGRWIDSVFFLLNASNGLAQLTATQALQVMGATWPTFETGSPRSRVRCVALHNVAISDFLTSPRVKATPFAPWGGANTLAMSGNASIVQGAFQFNDAPSSTNTQGIQVCIDSFVHNGARLSQVVARIQPAAAHAGLPGTQCSMGVFRKASAAALLEDLQAANSYVTDAQANTTAYQLAHALTYGCDQNHTIDTSAYSYFVQFWNEFGTNALPGLRVFGLELTLDTITDMRFP